MTIEKDNKTALKEAFDAELLKQLEENPPEIPSYEKFSSMIDGEVKKRRRRIHIISTAASIALLFLAGMATFSYFAPDIQADKNPKEEIITEDGVIIEDGGWGSSEWEDNVWMTEDWDEVEDAKKLFPKLLVPGFIPNGYRFKSLIVESIVEEDITSEYIFVNNQGDFLEIEIHVIESDTSSTSINMPTEILECSKGLLYLHGNNGNKIATIQIDDGISINIIYEISDYELITVIEELS